MQRISISIDDDLLQFIDRLSQDMGYTSRSEAVRDIVRSVATDAHNTDHNAPCLGVLTYVYKHETRELARRLASTQHDHHTTSIATLHVHIDHDDCLEVSVLRGRVKEVRQFADSITTQRGVRHGQLQFVPVAGNSHRGDTASDQKKGKSRFRSS